MLIFALLACRPAVPIPQDVEAQVVFAFRHFDDAEHVAQVAGDVLAFAGSDEPQLDEGYGVYALEASDLSAAGVQRISFQQSNEHR